jgi:electron transfer flavoprotein alpha/beta subunit
VIIVVCIKQVPEITEVKIDPKTKTLMREGAPSILNPLDEFAIEEALRIREKHGGEVIIVTMGPPQAKEAILKCLAMGADRAIHLSDKVFAGADTLTTAYTLAKAIKQFIPKFDIILCGKQAIDGDTAQVPVELAEWLNLTQITGVKKVEVDPKGRKVVAHSETDEGYEVIESKLPVLLTAIKELNEPRLPALRGILSAKKKETRVITAADLDDGDTELFGLNGSPTQVVEIFAPKPRGKGTIIIGEDPVATAKKIIQFLSEKGVI